MPRKKIKEITDKDIQSLFVNSMVTNIIHYDRTEEMIHLQDVYNKSKDPELRATIMYNVKKYLNDPNYHLVIVDYKMIAKNNYSNMIEVPASVITKYNTDNIPLTVVKDKLKFNLFDAANFK